jgi:glycosyltransferase involved in cell wall biosynthesis
MSKFQNAARSAGKLIVLTSHPIQYQAPLWRALAEELGKGREAKGARPEDDGRGGGGVPFEVWFLTDQGVRRTEDRDFGKAFAWDVDLLSGYPHRFLQLRGQWDMRKFDGIPLAKPIGASLREANATALWVEGWRFKPFWDAVSAAKKMGIPVFLRGETSDKIAEKGGLFGLVRNFALHRLFSKVDYFLAIGQASRRFYLRHGVGEEKLVDAPYGVDNEFFRSESRRIRGLRDCGTTGLMEEGARHEARGEGEEQPNAADQKTKRPRDESEKTDFEILTEGQRTIRAEWNIPLDAKVVMFCGKFVGKKRPVDVVRAAQVHQTTGPQDNRLTRNPWHLLFVGSGKLGEELRAACNVVYDSEKESGDGRQETEARGQEPGAVGGASEDASGSMLHAPCSLPPATFAGFLNQSEISKAYAIADVVVLPSEAWETWGLVVNEATAAGVPTVVSDRCGCSDDFGSKNPYTRVFPMGDVAAMTRAIQEVIALEAQPEEVTKYAEAFSPRITARAVAARLRTTELATDQDG